MLPEVRQGATPKCCLCLAFKMDGVKNAIGKESGRSGERVEMSVG